MRMKQNFVIRLPGDSEAQVAKRTLRLRQEAQQEAEERERRATMQLVAKAAARAILGMGPKPTATPQQVAALTDDEIKETVVTAAEVKRLILAEKRGGKR